MPAVPLLRPAHLTVATVCALASSALSCADPAAPVAPAEGAHAARLTTSREDGSAAAAATRRRLERAAAGLLYTSESDYPFEYVFFAARADAPLTEAAFRTAAGVPADSVVETVSLDEFFARHIERVDPADSAAVALVPRYRRLKRTLQTELRGVRVFRVGRIAIRCYAVGVDAHGNVVGLATTAVET